MTIGGGGRCFPKKKKENKQTVSEMGLHQKTPSEKIF